MTGKDADYEGEFSVVNAAAGVWRHDICGRHTTSPAEHTCVDLLGPLHASLLLARANSKEEIDAG